MKDLLKYELWSFINAKRPGTLSEWTKVPDLDYEIVSDKIFDVIDLRGSKGTIKRSKGSGEATYYNNGGFSLCFCRYEDFLNQFRECSPTGQILKDWTKGMSRPDYIVYDEGDTKNYFIIHELSHGNIQNKRKDGRLQLLNTVRLLCSIPKIKTRLQNDFGECLCYLSAKGCVESTPENIADGFLEIYKHLPEPIPFHNATIERNGFKAFESKVVKL